MSVSTRAYYLWEDDKKSGSSTLSKNDYWILANNIEFLIHKYNFFKDANVKECDECSICMEYLGKIECIKCTQKICGRCLTKIKKCPYCRAVPEYKN